MEDKELLTKSELINLINLLITERELVNNDLLTANDRNFKLKQINNKLLKFRKLLNDINHNKEKNKADDLVDSFGGYYSAWWDSDKGHFHICCSHWNSTDIEVKLSRDNISFDRKLFNLSLKDEKIKCKKYILDKMLECIEKEKTY